MKASKLLCKGCIGYWYYAIKAQSKGEKVEDIPIVFEFGDVFLENLPGLPLQRKTDFEIELVSGAQPISKPPYQMAPTELRDLKIQLDELLQKGFVRPSV